MTMLAGLLSLGGGLASGLGGLIGGNDQSRNYDDSVQEQQIRQMGSDFLPTAMLYGGDTAKTLTSMHWAMLRASEGDYGPLNEMMKDPGFQSLMAKTGGGGLINQYQTLGNKVIAKQNRQLGDFDLQTGQLAQGDMAYTNRLDSLGAGAEAIARRYGSGRRAQIEGDATRQIGDMDAATKASLAAAGLSNTSAVANELSSNRSETGRMKQAALNDVADAQSSKMLGARSQRIQTAAAAGGQSRTNAYGRAADRQTLIGQNLQRLIALKQQPLDIMRSTSLYNPGGYGTMSPNTATSGTANLLGSVGSSLGAFGGYLQGQNQLQGLLAQLQAARGGGSNN